MALLIRDNNRIVISNLIYKTVHPETDIWVTGRPGITNGSMGTVYEV